jgi:hypothetical protein
MADRLSPTCWTARLYLSPWRYLTCSTIQEKRFRSWRELLSWFARTDRPCLLGLCLAQEASSVESVIADVAAAELTPLADELVQASQPFVGQWSRLVSTTNWEKGRIIVEWRAALVSQGLPVAEYSDEAWARLVGGVTGQHVGRLRRVFQRFGQAKEKFPSLYWSHFQAAIEWDDAEMWLEGAMQSGWSVAQMRDHRWETLGKVEAERPAVPFDADTDEDAEPARAVNPPGITGQYSEVTGPQYDGPDFGDDGDGSSLPSNSDDAAWLDGAPSVPPVALVKPFENLPDLPDDLADAFDAMKLAILRHKREGWQEIALADVMRTLEALKALAAAPADDA